MTDQELFYGHNSVAIVGALFVVIILFNEIGFQLGRYIQSRTADEVKSLTGSIQASILGLLALLLGFSFSMSMQRFDSRSMAVIEEANAIGTAILRVQLLPDQLQQDATRLFRNYVELRVAVGQIDLTRADEREKLNRQTSGLQDQLWRLAVRATDEDPRPVTTGAFIQSLNDVIDSQGKRNALLQMHVPEIVIVLLFIIFVASGGMLGYSNGLSGKRIAAPVVLISLLITLIVFIIIDLDRPKRGLIQVNQDAMKEVLIFAQN